MKAKATDILDAVPALQEIAKQPMGLLEAEQIADFNEKLQPVLEQIEEQRRVIVIAYQEANDAGEDLDSIQKESNDKLVTLAEREFEVPEIKFSQYHSIKITPAQVSYLKRLKIF